jgi:Uma2 family endonuclease
LLKKNVFLHKKQCNMTTSSAILSPQKQVSVRGNRLVSLEKYFQAEEIALYKNEYHNGKIIKMASGTVLHDNLGSRFVYLLTDFVENNDLNYIINGSDTKIRIESYDKVVYPDAVVICEKPIYYNNRRDTITNPLIIVEVLSDSTRNFDRTIKFDYYRSLESFMEYILVRQDCKLVSVFSKQMDNTWILRDYEGDEAVAMLYALHECPIALKRLYRNLGM